MPGIEIAWNQVINEPGNSRVEIFANKEQGFNKGMNQATIVQYLPKKYNDETTLSKEVLPGEENVFNFDLEE